jgi:hypothetical protein
VSRSINRLISLTEYCALKEARLELPLRPSLPDKSQDSIAKAEELVIQLSQVRLFFCSLDYWNGFYRWHSINARPIIAISNRLSEQEVWRVLGQFLMFHREFTGSNSPRKGAAFVVYSQGDKLVENALQCSEAVEA